MNATQGCPLTALAIFFIIAGCRARQEAKAASN